MPYTLLTPGPTVGYRRALQSILQSTTGHCATSHGIIDGTVYDSYVCWQLKCSAVHDTYDSGCLFSTEYLQ